MCGFRGIPADGIAFLRDLGRDNSDDFFQAHKARWQQGLLEPGRALVEALGPQLRALDPEIQWSPKVNGSLFTVRRDTRFSKDKRPYKEELGLRFWHGPDRKACRSTLHMRVTADYVGFGAGVWNFEPAELLRYRAAVADDARGPVLADAVEGLRMNSCGWQKNEYKRVPSPYPADHPREELLRQRGLAVGFDVPHPQSLGTPEFAAFCAEQFAKLAPLHQWLNAALDQL